jgi:hypothetical protein
LKNDKIKARNINHASQSRESVDKFQKVRNSQKESYDACKKAVSSSNNFSSHDMN